MSLHSAVKLILDGMERDRDLLPVEMRGRLDGYIAQLKVAVAATGDEALPPVDETAYHRSQINLAKEEFRRKRLEAMGMSEEDIITKLWAEENSGYVVSRGGNLIPSHPDAL